MYRDASDPLVALDDAALARLAAAAGLSVRVDELHTAHELLVAPGVLDRWFARRPDSYRGRLAAHLAPHQLDAIEARTRAALRDHAVRWGAVHWIVRLDATVT